MARTGPKPRNPPPPDPPGTDRTGQKWCGKCQQWKTVINFAVDNKAADRLQDYCRPCHNSWAEPSSRRKALEQRLEGSGSLGTKLFEFRAWRWAKNSTRQKQKKANFE